MYLSKQLQITLQKQKNHIQITLLQYKLHYLQKKIIKT